MPSPRPSATATHSYEQSSWTLDRLVPGGSEKSLERLFQGLERATRELEARRGELTEKLEPERFLEILREYERFVERAFVVSAYGQLLFSSDTQSVEALTLRNRIEHKLMEWQNRSLFLTLWWRGLDDAAAERLLPDAKREPDLRHHLLDLRRLRRHTLDEASEKIINLKDANGVDALIKLYSMLTNRLEFRIEVDGEVEVLTRDELTAYVTSPRAELRRQAYDELLRVYRRESRPLAEIYVHRVRDWDGENRKLRGYASPIAVRNTANDVPDEAVEVLLDAVRDHGHLFRRYFRLKARLLGMDRLRRYDLYAPLASSERRVPYDEGVRMVLDTFRDFHPGFAQRAERVFRDGHIDSELRKGKRSGAFCATVLPSQTPWLLVNYTGRIRDVATLAHELGHAVHSLLAEEHSVLTQHSSLPLAETSSVFAEMLLTDRLLREESDPGARRELLATALDDIYGTVQRQAYFVRFEVAAHQSILDGASSDQLNDLYYTTLEEQFGDSVELVPEFRYEWLAIPHFYNAPFYCYSYSFGQLLVLSLYRRYQEEGESFIPGYLKTLAYGGSARPETILAETGVDMTDPAFWAGGFAVVGGLLDELAALETG
ncbi:MAG: M3 family oligoendopeptidase [Thermoanaerobaculia bacterium]|nr:M3 family oligoendopeptidase [Thermoanaerobaculia bacterium]